MLSHEVKVIKGARVEWGACSRTVSLGIHEQALSYWNNTIAVGSWDENIIILDAITSSQMAVFSGHTNQVNCLTFSSDGMSLVSGSDDNTVKLWDMQTGGVVKTFFGHTMQVLSVSISADHTRIASGSRDCTVYLWDIQTGECHCTIQQQDSVHHVSFSPMDPQYIISISSDKVWQWDINDCQISSTYDGTHIAFSPDHTQLALCNGKVVTVQNCNSRAIVAELHITYDNASYCCFSPDGRLVAIAAWDTAYVWDITNSDPHLVETFVGHNDVITSLVFSSPSSLISISFDKSLKFWQIGGLSTDSAPIDPESTLLASSPIKSVSLQARVGIAISTDVDGVIKVWDISTSLCRETFQILAAKGTGFGEGDAKLIDGRLIFVWYKDKKIHIWDTGKEELLQTLDVLGSSLCRGLRISGDGSKVFCLLGRSIQAWSMWSWEPMDEVKLRLGQKPYLDPLCIDSSRVWIHSSNSPAQEGWDFEASDSSPIPFDPSTGRPCLDFIGGASWQTGSPSWIMDTVTGKEVFQLSGEYVDPVDVQWDGQYLVAGYNSGEILILDFHHLLSRDV